MSEERIAQLEADERIQKLGLSRDELASLTELADKARAQIPFFHSLAPVDLVYIVATCEIGSLEEMERLADLTEKLRPSTLFRRLPLEQLAYIVQSGTVRTLERGEMLIEQGDTDRVMYVILEGQLRVWETNAQGKRQLLGYHYAGDFTGEMIMLDGDERIANVDAVEESKVVAFDEEGWARISKHPSILNMIQKAGPERVQEHQYPFSGKQLDEVIVERARRSWVALLRRAIVPILFTLVLVALVILLASSDRLGTHVAAIVAMVLVLLTILWILWLWRDWENDDFLVTSKRIIHIERVLMPPFPVERHEAAIQTIQDIRTTNQGLWTLLFGVKTVVIRTMGSGTIRFPDLNNADEVREKIFQAQKHAQSRTVIPGPTLIRQRLSEVLGFEVPRVVALDSEPQEGSLSKKRRAGWLDYFVPHMRIVEPDKITWRRHWLIMLSRVILPLLAMAASLALAILPALLRALWLWAIPGVVALLASFGWYLWQYEGWRNDVYQVTDSRIIDIEGSPFHLRKETHTEGMFDVIQNVTYDSPNLFYRALRIGFVTIDTAAEQGAYTFDWVSRPAEVQQEIFTRWTAYREKQKEAATRQRHQEFLDWIREYDRLVRQED